MKLFISLFILLCFAGPSVAQIDYVTIQTKREFSQSWMNAQTKLVDLIPGFNSTTDGRDDFNRYGSYKYLRTDSTGFFYVKEIDERWWVIDPDGYAGINMAVGPIPATRIQDNYDLIKRNGFFATGNFLANENQTKDVYNAENFDNLSYTRRPNFYLRYQFRRHNYYPTPEVVRGSYNHILVLDPHFEQWCDSIAKVDILPYAQERDLLGYFTDNEINFNQDQLRNLVNDLPQGDPSREAALSFAISKGLTEQQVINNSISETIKREFAAYLADHYFKTVKEAIRRYDQNHLILGARLHGRPRAISEVVAASHLHMDVTSVNFYDNFAPAQQIARPEWTQDKPILVGEFYIKDINIFSTSQSGAGWYVKSQQERGYFYQNACIDFLTNGNFVGWHFFRFEDEVDSNKGMVSYGSNPQEYVEMTQYMAQLNNQVYRLIDHFDGKDRRPHTESYSLTVTVAEDTYVSTDPASIANYGNETEMEAFNFWNVNNRREAFLKFNLREQKDLLPELKNARLEMYCTQSNTNNRVLMASGIDDNSWDEQTLTGTYTNANPAWSHTFNRLDALRGVIEPGKIEFDVTNWVKNQGHKEELSFKLHENRESGAPIRFATQDHPEAAWHPRLVLTFWGEDINASSKEKNRESFAYFVAPNNNIHINNPDNHFNHYQLIALTGQVMNQGILTGDVINASQLHTGIYILRLSGNANAAVKVFIRK
jgi:hypothetical protein